MTEHSPAPWKLTLAGTQWGISSKRQDRNEIDLANGSQFRDRWEADTKLLLASPDLFAAAGAVLESMKGKSGSAFDWIQAEDTKAAFDALRKAYRKAGGGTQKMK